MAPRQRIGHAPRQASSRRRIAKAAEDRHIGFRWLKREAGLASEHDAEAVFRAVAWVFGRRVGRGEARHVAAHLPLGLREVWDEETRNAGSPQGFERTEFIRSVAARLGVETTQAEILVATVFAWLKHLAPEEIADIATILPARLREVWETAHVPQFPPWRNLMIIRPPEPLRVRLVVVEPDRVQPVEQADENVFRLPVRGSRLWRGGRAFMVERVVDTPRPRIVLVRDFVREASLYADVPEGCRIMATQRPDGTWFARVLDAEGHLLAWSSDESCDEAVDAAHADAVRLSGVAGGYHPERETE
jgi:uncharacterized protein (DUF2267 family)